MSGDRIVVLGFTERDLDGIASLALAGKDKGQTDLRCIYEAFVKVGMTHTLAEKQAELRCAVY